MTKPSSRRMSIGIRQKMILVLLSVLTIALTATSWLTLQRYQDDVFRETHQRGKDITRFVSESLVYSVIGYDYHTIQLLLDKIVATQDVVYASVVNARGNVMAETGTKPQDDAQHMVFTESITYEGETIGVVTVGLDNGRIIRQLEAQKSSLITREIGIIALIALGEFLALSYIIVRPVSIISRFLDSGVDAQGRVVRDIPLDTTDEFGRLAHQFNDIRAQLCEANERLQSKIDLADAKLRETNAQLLTQSRELRRMNVELKRMSITDALTGLYNRRHFEHIMDTEVKLSLRHGEPNSILIIDIDFFKKINDTYGHKTGDRVLRRVASILSETLRRTDVLCRVGGEEFVALCKRVTPAHAMVVGEKIRQVIRNYPFMAGEDRLAITVSIGVSSIPNQYDTRSTDELFEQADSALYYSKTKGRNRVTHFFDIKERVNANPEGTSIINLGDHR